MTIVVPRGAEARAIRGLSRTQVFAVPAGASSAAALPALDRRCTVLVMGLCGALRELRVGSVVIYARVRDARGTFALDAGRIARLAQVLPAARIVTACTGDRIVTRVAERGVLAARYDADVVDMEGTHLASELAARGVPFAMVRVVSDDASRDLPPFADAFDPSGRLRPLRLAFGFARAPRAGFAFARDARAALATLTGVAHAVGRAEA